MKQFSVYASNILCSVTESFETLHDMEVFVNAIKKTHEALRDTKVESYALHGFGNEEDYDIRDGKKVVTKTKSLVAF